MIDFFFFFDVMIILVKLEIRIFITILNIYYKHLTNKKLLYNMNSGLTHILYSSKDGSLKYYGSLIQQIIGSSNTL